MEWLKWTKETKCWRECGAAGTFLLCWRKSKEQGLFGSSAIDPVPRHLPKRRSHVCTQRALWVLAPPLLTAAWAGKGARFGLRRVGERPAVDTHSATPADRGKKVKYASPSNKMVTCQKHKTILLK